MGARQYEGGEREGTVEMKEAHPSRISLARRRRGIPRHDLGLLIGQAGGRAIVDYESGRRAPSEETLRKIAVALDFPIEFFYGPTLEEPSPGAISHL